MFSNFKFLLLRRGRQVIPADPKLTPLKRDKQARGPGTLTIRLVRSVIMIRGLPVKPRLKETQARPLRPMLHQALPTLVTLPVGAVVSAATEFHAALQLLRLIVNVYMNNGDRRTATVMRRLARHQAPMLPLPFHIRKVMHQDQVP